MKKSLLILTILSSMIGVIYATNDSFLNKEDKAHILTLAKNYTKYGLGAMGAGILSSVQITTNGRTVALPQIIRSAGNIVGVTGYVALSPVLSAAMTASLPVTAPVLHALVKKGVNLPNIPEQLKNPLVKKLLPGAITRKFVFRAPLPALIGFGIPVFAQKYLNGL